MGEKDNLLQIAILLYPGVTALDAVGPWEVLSRIPNTEIRFVGKEIEPVVTEGDVLLLGVTQQWEKRCRLIWCLYRAARPHRAR